jgi:hypothetical protein
MAPEEVFGVKIMWQVHPLLKIDIDQRYIFAPKIYLHPEDFFFHYLWGEDKATQL